MTVSTGVFGGTFDPPHVGHVELARRGIERFGLERLLVRVVADPGHREVATPAEIRLGLAELAFASLDEAVVALDPHARTVDSLRALALDEPVFLLGADEFASFLGWKEPERVVELARLGVATRPGTPRERLDAVLVQLPEAARERVVFFRIEPHDVSSSRIRALAARGGDLTGLVPPAVAAELTRLGPYRTRQT